MSEEIPTINDNSQATTVEPTEPVAEVKPRKKRSKNEDKPVELKGETAKEIIVDEATEVPEVELTKPEIVAVALSSTPVVEEQIYVAIDGSTFKESDIEVLMYSTATSDYVEKKYGLKNGQVKMVRRIRQSV